MRRVAMLHYLVSGFLVSVACAQSGAATSFTDDAWRVKSAEAVHGHLEITLRDGRVIVVPPTAGQCSFDDIAVAPDQRTVGWISGSSVQLASDPFCEPGPFMAFAGPILWRGGRVVRQIGESGGEVDWLFVGSGDRVAVHAGPYHFDTDHTVHLYDARTGGRLGSWHHASNTPPPAWAKPFD